MDFNVDVIAKLLAPAITTIVGLIVKAYVEGKPKLITYLVHASAIHLGGQQNQNVNSHSVVVRNSGKKTANNVRVGHNYLPAFQIVPALAYQIVQGTNGSAEILIPTLVPGEQVTISYLYFPPVVWSQVHAYCKSDEMSAKYINVVPSAQLNRFQIAGLSVLLFVGASTFVYWGIYLLWAWVQ